MEITYTQEEYREINFVNTPERYKYYFRRSGEYQEEYLIYLLNQIFHYSKIEKGIVIENNINITIRDISAPINQDDYFDYFSDKIVFFFNDDDIILKYNVEDDFFILGVKDTVESDFSLSMEQIGFLTISDFIKLENYFLKETDKEKVTYLYGVVPHKYYEKKITTLNEMTKGIIAIISIFLSLAIMISLPFFDVNSDVSILETFVLMCIFLMIFGLLFFIVKTIKGKYFKKKD